MKTLLFIWGLVGWFGTVEGGEGCPSQGPELGDQGARVGNAELAGAASAEGQEEASAAASWKLSH